MQTLTTLRRHAPLVGVVAAFVGLAALFLGGLARPESTAPYAIPVETPRPAASLQTTDLSLGASALAGIPEGASTGGGAQPASRSEPVSVEIAAVAARTGIPERALVAYASASEQLRAAIPACGISWSQLAAVGAVESAHGTHGGSTLGDDGRVSPAILGPALDGGEFQRIADSDGGVLDGDAVTDRAIGPFQFIPQTWERWASDGDGDRITDPQDIDDAALAAGRYLCAYGSLEDDEVWRRAVFAYNHDDAYVDLVTRRVLEYETLAG